MPVSVGDNIKFAINFYNSSGLVDVDSIKWLAPILEPIPQIPKHIQTNFLDGIDRNRICELEEMFNEWVTLKYFEGKNKFEYDLFNPQFNLTETKIAGSDTVSIRSQYLVSALGKIAMNKLRI